MEQLSNLWGKLKDGSLCRERPLEVWGVSLVLVGGVALLAQAVLSSDSKPTAAQAAFEEGKAVVLASGKAVKVVRVPNTSSGISAAAATLGKQLGSSPLTAAFAAAVSAAPVPGLARCSLPNVSAAHPNSPAPLRTSTLPGGRRLQLGCTAPS